MDELQKVAVGRSPLSTGVRRLAPLFFGVALTYVWACQADTTVAPRGASESRAATPTAAVTKRLTSKQMRNRAPRLADTNACFTSERQTAGGGREFKFEKVRLEAVQADSIRSSGDTASATPEMTRFYFVRWNKQTGQGTFQASCVIPKGDAAFQAAVNRFSITGATFRGRGSSSRGADNARALDSPAGQATQPESADDHDFDGGAQSSAPYVDDTPDGRIDEPGLSAIIAEMGALAAAPLLPAGLEAECGWDYLDSFIDCGDLQCSLEEGGVYDCHNGCTLNETGEIELIDEPYWYCAGSGDVIDCELLDESYEVHFYRWDCDGDYCGPSPGAPEWFDPPEECEPEEELEDEEPCDTCTAPDPPEGVELHCHRYLVGQSARCELAVVDTSGPKLDSITWWFVPWATSDSMPGGTHNAPTSVLAMPVTPPSLGAIRTAYKFGGEPRFSWVQVYSRDSTAYDQCDGMTPEEFAAYAADSTLWETLPIDTLEADVTSCTGSTALAAVACMDSTPGVWVGSRVITVGRWDHVNLHNNSDTAPPPRVVAELSRIPTPGWDTITMKVDTAVTYPNMTFADYRWTRLSATSPYAGRSLFKTIAETVAAYRNTLYNGTKKYLLGESNSYVSLILKLAGLTITPKEHASIKGSAWGPWRLCQCSGVCGS